RAAADAPARRAPRFRWESDRDGASSGVARTANAAGPSRDRPAPRPAPAAPWSGAAPRPGCARPGLRAAPRGAPPGAPAGTAGRGTSLPELLVQRFLNCGMDQRGDVAAEARHFAHQTGAQVGEIERRHE